MKDVAEVDRSADDLAVGVLATAVCPPAVDDELPVHRLLIGQHVGLIRGIHPLIEIQRSIQSVIRRNQLAGRIAAADRVGTGADPHIGGLRAEDLLEQFGADPGFGDGAMAGSRRGCRGGCAGIGGTGRTRGFGAARRVGCVRASSARAIGLGRQAAGFGACAAAIVRTAAATSQEKRGHRSGHH